MVLKNHILALVAVIDAVHMYYIPLDFREKPNSQNAPGSQKCHLILPLIHDRNARKLEGFLTLSVKNAFQTKLTISVEEDRDRNRCCDYALKGCSPRNSTNLLDQAGDAEEGDRF